MSLHSATSRSIMSTRSLKAGTGDFPVIRPQHSRIQLNHMSSVDKHSWNNASAAEPACTIKKEEVMSACTPCSCARSGWDQVQWTNLRVPYLPEAAQTAGKYRIYLTLLYHVTNKRQRPDSNIKPVQDPNPGRHITLRYGIPCFHI